ncbi:FHA domain-containing protein [Pyxidicoccus parkwayensis]|uniref:FHA domain-containing protein n=1 Tax=Pyxidicoccus parkwayensis TaxID=2813578 RepID=A0ABX7NQ47_9BACT|nr:FHA domain-containing protein [Pyxidicoccus parkwaysis]QSQ19579.1 FHA domain-containing protein [Pyxidicoccus parkwaysis]
MEGRRAVACSEVARSLSRAVKSLALLAALCAVLPASAAENGVRVLAVPPASGGTLQLQVEVEPDLDGSLRQGNGLDPSRFRALLEQSGGRVTAVRRMVDENQDAYTLLAFDQSGSFATYWPQALDLATAYVGALKGSRHTVSVMSFGMSRTTHCEEKTPAALTACLKGLASLGASQQVTRLKSYVQEAVREAVKKQPLASRGSREVIVFTDAGDESDALDVKTVAAEARELGVRVHVVCFTRTAKGRKLAQRLDEMRQLADGSGGRYLQVEDVKDPARVMVELAGALDRLYWLDVALCGVKPGQVYDNVSIEAVTGGQRTHWSEPVRFRQSTEGGATQPCTPQPAATPSPEQQPAATTAQAPAPASPSWWWLLLVGAGLAIAGTLVGLLARRRAPAATPAPPQPPAPQVVAPQPPPAPAPAPPTAAPMAPAAPWKDPFVTLPETRLVVKQGPAGLEPYYRVHKAEFTIGARSGEMDLAIEHPAISGHHATVQLYKTGNVFVVDQRSTNGTWVDGRRLEPGQRVQLKPGQSLRLSQHVELVLTQPGTQPRAAEPAPSASAPAPAPVAAPPAQGSPAPAPEGGRAKAKTLFAPAREDES